MIIKILAVVVLVLLKIPHSEGRVILIQYDYIVSIQLCNQLDPIFEALQSVDDEGGLPVPHIDRVVVACGRDISIA